MTKAKYIYNTNLAKGTGLVNENLMLIEFYDKTDSKQSFLNRCIAENILDKSTEHRTKDIVSLVFFDRFWNDKNVITFLKRLRDNGLSLDALKSLFLVYTAKANFLFFDFVVELYSSHKNKKISSEISKNFILNAISEGKAPSWSTSMISKVSSYLLSCAKELNVLTVDGYLHKKNPDQLVVNYLLHELHFDGRSNQEITHDNLWKLFGMTRHDIISEIEKLSFRGAFIFQYSGEILNIGWNYQSMDEFIENECR
jgi:hypothetical protein